MAVFPLIFRRELHIVAVQRGQEFVVFRRGFEGFPFKNDIRQCLTPRFLVGIRLRHGALLADIAVFRQRRRKRVIRLCKAFLIGKQRPRLIV